MVSRISIALLPSEAALAAADCSIVVDTLRATTTLAALFARGLVEVWVASDIDLARRLAADHGAVLLGEVGGLPPAGFAMGNSPLEVMQRGLASQRAVLFTTNGTKALCEVAPRGVTFAGAMVNASAVARAARRFERVRLVCAGESGGRGFALEDFAVAAAIAEVLGRGSDGVERDDAATLASASDEHLRRRWIGEAAHAGVLRALGLSEDISFASEPDTLSCAPYVAEFGDGWARLTDGAPGTDIPPMPAADDPPHD